MIVTFRIPETNGASRLVDFDVSQSPPVEILTGAEPGSENPPVVRNALKKPGTGEPAPRSSSPTGDDRGFPDSLGGISGVEIKDLGSELQQAQEALAQWSSELAGIDGELAPSWPEKKQIEDAIRGTLRRSEAGATVIDFAGRSRRSELFERLDEHTQKWGPLRQKRKAAALEVRLLEKDIERLAKLVHRNANKRKAA